MASMDLDTRRYGADEMHYFSRLTILFAMWACAMRVVSALKGR